MHTCGTCYLRRDFQGLWDGSSLDADSCTAIAQVYPASMRLMGLLSTMEPRTYSGKCAR